MRIGHLSLIFLAPDKISYQGVAVPDQQKNWVRVHQIIDWTEIDPMPLFR